MKKLFVVLLVIALSTVSVFAVGATGTFAGLKTVNVQLNGTPIESDVPGVVLGGRTVLPLRAVAENLNAIVDWNQTTMTANLLKPDVNLIVMGEGTENEDGSWDVKDPSCTMYNLGAGYTVGILYYVGPMEKQTIEYRIVVKDPKGKTLQSDVPSTYDMLPDEGMMGYTYLNNISFQTAGIHPVEFQIKYNGTFTTVGKTSLYVQ